MKTAMKSTRLSTDPEAQATSALCAEVIGGGGDERA